MTLSTSISRPLITQVSTRSFPSDIWENTISFDPEMIHSIARVSRSGRIASLGMRFFTVNYFRDLTTILGKKKLNNWIGQINWTPSRALLDNLTMKVYNRLIVARLDESTTSSLLRKGITSPKHLVTIITSIKNINKIQKEEDRNTIIFANCISYHISYNTEWSDTKRAIEKKNRYNPFVDVQSIVAQAARAMIANIPEKTKRTITRLRIVKESLSMIPQELFSLTYLIELNLRDNKIEKIPKGIERLINLKYLYLSDNKITTVSPTIGELTKLEELDLGNNRIQDIHTKIYNLPKLIKLYLRNNNKLNQSAKSALDQLKDKAIKVVY